MFSRMLRPSRRQHHERVSQNEDSDNNTNIQNGIVILDDNNTNQEHDLNLEEGDNSNTNNMDEEDDDEELRAALALSMQQDDTTATGGESQEQQSATAESSFANEDNNTQLQETTNATTTRTTVHFTTSSSDEDEDDNILQPNILIRQPSTISAQTQRELQHRRQSTCTLLLLFFLIRLWIEALIEMKPELIFLSVMGSVWTYRFFISRRLAEEEENEQQGTVITANNRRESGLDPAVNYDPDLGLMSFQAQLALAILESQRQAFENTQNGGYNRNSNNTDDEGPGVTPEAKSKWKTYDWGKGDNIEENTKLAVSTSRSSLEAIIERANSSGTLDGGGGGGSSSRDYGTLEHEQIDIEEQKQANGLIASLDDEEPSCSICLCEYELGEKVTRLPCDHIYHTSCLNSWTEHHTRCPLCNHDLMEGFDQPVNIQQMARQHAEEARAFRSMALSSLGRRIRTRRRGSNRRGQSRGNTASALLAAAEDSIV